MYWQYRVINRTNAPFDPCGSKIGIHETYFMDDNSFTFAVNPVQLFADTRPELELCVRQLTDALNLPTIMWNDDQHFNNQDSVNMEMNNHSITDFNLKLNKLLNKGSELFYENIKHGGTDLSEFNYLLYQFLINLNSMKKILTRIDKT